MNVVAFSGGKDSTALALRMHELREPFRLLFTPTGNELPDLAAHIRRVVEATGAELIRPANRGLAEWIDTFNALPNWRQRWCTRVIKIEPCVAWLKANSGSVLCVGLRADEEERVGLYGDFATYRYPLREWGWNKSQVLAYCAARGFSPPARTDCAVCPYQRLGEWFRLWRDNPAHFAQGEAWEAKTGFTFRSPQRDTWPAALKDLRAEFEGGRVPRGAESADAAACRVCSL